MLKTLLEIELALLNSSVDKEDLPLNRADNSLHKTQCIQ